MEVEAEAVEAVEVKKILGVLKEVEVKEEVVRFEEKVVEL